MRKIKRAAGRRAAELRAKALRGKWICVAEELEQRRLLFAAILPVNPVIYADAVSGPLAPRPGHTFYVSGLNAQGTATSQWANASAITPNTTNDLVLNAVPFNTNYQACCEGAGGSASLLTNGITQTQTAPSPGPGNPAVGDGGASDPSNNANVIAGAAGSTYFFDYNLNSAPGAAPSTTGYDISEIDVIAGHQDQNAKLFSIDVLVEFINTNQFISLSGGQGFSLNQVIDTLGNPVPIGKGSVQMGIANDPSGPIEQGVRAVRFVTLDPTTFLREFVVTGSPTATLPPPPPAALQSVSATLGAGGVTVSWAFSSYPGGYVVQRSSNSTGPWTNVGNTATHNSLVDATALPNITYFYRVLAVTPFGSSTSATSPALIVPPYGASAYFFQTQSWQGTPAISDTVPVIDFDHGNRDTAFPLTSALNSDHFSSMFDGKITTRAAGSYTFVTNTDDDGYLYVNGQLVSANPGVHSPQNATTTIPIHLDANIAYDFVFLEDNRAQEWAMHLSWNAVGDNGSSLPLALVPTDHLSPTPSTPPAPQQTVANVLASNRIQLTWNPVGDTSSFGYVVERAPADINGNPTGAFAVIGQAFSGPPLGGTAPATWGATGFLDTTAVPNTRYVYRVGSVLPGQALPANFGAPSAPVTTPPAATASLVSGLLSIQLGATNDEVSLSVDSGDHLIVTEGTADIFSAVVSDISSLYVTGISAAPQTLTIGGALTLPGFLWIGQLSDVVLSAPITAAQASIAASSSIAVNAPLTTSGPITLDADSDAVGPGTLTIPAGVIISSAGNPILVHAAVVALAGLVDAGPADVTYSFSPGATVDGTVLSQTSTSGTLTLTQSSAASFALTAIAGAGVTGKLLLQFPGASLTLPFLDTSAGNASVEINAASVQSTGPLVTGAGSVTLDALSSSFTGPLATAGLFFPPAGATTFAAGASAHVNGAIDGGVASVGPPAGGPPSTLSADSFDLIALTINPNATLSLIAGTPDASSTNTLAIAPGGKLDLANNALLINYAGQSDPFATIRSYLAGGYNNGTWNGSGIVSSTAANNLNHNTGIGWADSSDGTGVNAQANTIELKYTLNSDANLDGKVTLADFGILATNFGKPSGASWSQGDFNYDGAVTLADFGVLAANFGQVLPAAVSAAGVLPAPATGAPPIAAAPVIVASIPVPTRGANLAQLKTAAELGAARLVSTVSSEDGQNGERGKHLWKSKVKGHVEMAGADAPEKNRVTEANG